jgi:SAM-dependent methyltransferase
VYDDDKSLALDSVRHGSVRCMNGDAKRIIADGYDRMGRGFAEWNATRPSDGRRWFLDEVVARLPEGSTVLELGCGPGTDASELSAGRRYVGMDVSPGQLSIARDRVPSGMFVVGATWRPLPFGLVRSTASSPSTCSTTFRCARFSPPSRRRSRGSALAAT